MKTVSYSEMFLSHQGEGARTGRLSLWLRLWGCTLRCPGFGQEKPFQPTSYKKYDFDPSEILKLDDLPLLTHGCDSAYSWDPRFKQLAIRESSLECAKKLGALLPSFGYDFDVTFTGGEPLMQQKAILEIFNALNASCEPTLTPVIETNATLKLTSEFKSFTQKTNLIFSISPKLETVSGEKDAINFDNIEDYIESNEQEHYLKFVVTHQDDCWNELDNVLKKIKYENRHVPVYVMPVGATKTSQETEEVRLIAQKAMDRGLNLSVRVQNIVWNNAIGR